MPTDTETADLAALTDLVKSEGWRVFLKLVDDAWGAESTLRMMENAIKQVPRGEQDAINDTVQQIQVARREVQKVLAMPVEAIKKLQPVKTWRRPFADQRRA